MHTRPVDFVMYHWITYFQYWTIHLTLLFFISTYHYKRHVSSPHQKKKTTQKRKQHKKWDKPLIYIRTLFDKVFRAYWKTWSSLLSWWVDSVGAWSVVGYQQSISKKGYGCVYTWETIKHYTLTQNQVKEHCCSIFHSYNSVFNNDNEHNSYPKWVD